MRTAAEHASPENAQGNAILKVATASSIGTTIEWYDFFIYSTAASLVFNKLFFPDFDSTVGTLAAFATFGVGFAARPIGAAVSGHLGDKIGRKQMLILTMLVMGAATFLLGLLPTYATIGVWAPILLVTLRLLQGFGVGGEWGGAVIMAVEHAPPKRRGFYASWPQIGVPLGLVLATLAFVFMSMLPDEEFYSWGWRVPFLFSIVLVGVGLFIRISIDESPVFERMRRSASITRAPLLEVFRSHSRNLLLGMGSRLVLDVTFYIFTVFSITYATDHIGMAKSTVLIGVLVAATIELAAIPFFGGLSDRIGRRGVYQIGAVFLTLFSFPYFLLINSGTPVLVWFALLLGLCIGHGATYAAQASFFAELFPSRVRYSGMSLTYNLEGLVGGGPAPFIAIALLMVSAGHWWPVALYMVVVGVISVVCTYYLRETAGKPLDPVEPSGEPPVRTEAAVPVAADVPAGAANPNNAG